VRELVIAAVVVTAYAALLTGAAEWAERREAGGRPVTRNRYVYALALGVYATSWTFYGSVGLAARTGLLFLTVYLGPTLCAAGWWWIVRKLVRLKNTQHVTSLPDVLALRYGKSQVVALLASAVLVVGLIPYIALQLKTMIATLSIVAGGGRFTYPGSGRQLGPPLVVFLLLFTIAFGLRRVRPAERHPGMMCALALESVVKLVAFLAAGAFVVWGLFDGPGDVFRAATAPSVDAPALLGRQGVGAWLAHLVLSALAVLLLPRQFHIAVIENSDEDHLRTATWLFPAYLLLINLFVLPVALGALVLRGSASAADTFVLSLPLDAHLPVLSWLVFLGGFSAGTGMVIVETTALSTILSNHVVLPAADAWAPLGRLRRHVLPIRWVAAAALLVAAFAYERFFGAGYSLASIGLVSFAAVIQLGPALVGGLFWSGASRMGAIAGMAGGFATWLYTLVVPVLARVGWLPASLLSAGPFGVEALRPEGLFYLRTDPVTHAVVWTLLVNVGAFVTGSLLWPSRRTERSRADRLLAVLGREPAERAAPAGPLPVSLRAKRAQTVALLESYHPRADAEALADGCLAEIPGGADEQLRPLQLASFLANVERTLAGAIGSAAAHAAVRRAGLVTPDESGAISAAYGELLAGLNLSPEELLRKIDYHRERERLLARDAADQQFLAGVGSLLSSSLDVQATAASAVRIPLPHLAAASLLALRSAGVLRTWFAHVDPDRERAGREALERLPLREPGSVARALRTGRASTCRPPDPDWPAELATAVGPVDLEATFPLISAGERLGTLTLFAPGGSRVGAPEGLALGDELARRLAIAVDNARLYASAEEAVRARDEFLAVASHELKTPLTPLRIQIQALQRLVRRGELEAISKEKLAKLVVGADVQVVRIVALIDRLLDLTRIRAKQLRLDVGPMDLAATVRATIEQHEAQLRDAGCRVVVDAAAPVFGTWDRVRVEQVVANLVTNAAKYAPGAPVNVRVSADPAAHRARVEVQDEGPGIPDAAQERLFRPFERAGGVGAAAGGLGLGLFIVREIVEAHGGAVRLRSSPGHGTSFVVELPFRPPARA
jgi:Na+/proline symporter/signal transduction histidine kinase